MQVLQSYDKSGNIDVDKLTDNFIKNIPDAQIRGDDGTATDISDDNRITDLPVTVVVDGYDFTIWGSGTVTGEGEEKPERDKLNITSLNLTSTEDSITAKVQASNGNGATYTYYYKLSSSNDWIEIHKGTETTCTIEGLEPNTSYDIKVEATNGDESSSKNGTISTQDNRDLTPPTVQVTQGAVTDSSISISASATDGESGMPDPITYRYYIKKSTDGSYGSPVSTNNNSDYTFSGLESNTTYDIKVEADDNSGNTGSGELRGVKTLITIPDANAPGVIDIEGPKWNGDGTADITITKGDNVDDDLDIEYKKEGDDDYTKLEDGGTIPDLQEGDKIHIHLTDGDRDGEDIVIEIKDETPPTVNVNKGTVTETSITVNVVATDDQSGMPSLITYNYYIKKSTDLSYPTQATTNTTGTYTFGGLDAKTSYDIKVEATDNAGNIGSGELTGVTTLITIPGAGDEGAINIDGPNWHDDGTADVTITKGNDVDDSLTIEYKKDDDDNYTPLTDGDSIDGLKHGDTIHIHLTDGDRDGEDIVIEIKDETPPTVNVTQGATSTNGITVNVNVHDGEGGMPDTPTYNYYIKKTDDPEYPTQPTATDTNASYTFSGLEQGVSYDIKVEVADKAGNTGTGTLPGVRTDTIPDPGDGQTGSIIWGNINWDSSQGTASVTVSKGAGVDESLQLQYQVVIGNSAPTEGAYQTIANGGTISDIANGSTVYARLWDGNNGGNPASIKIEDSTPPTVAVNKGEVTETAISVTVNANDNETGMPSPATYKYYIKRSTDTSYPTTPTETSNTANYTFEGLINNTSYDIKVEVADNAGNTGSGELNLVKTLITIPAGDVEGAINVEGPTWSGGQATITVTKSDDVDDSLYLEYKKEGDQDYTRLEGTAIGNLVNGDKIYIHLTDGTRDGTDKVITISDTTPPSVGVSKGTVTTNSITVNVNANDGESGMSVPPTYEYYIKESTTPTYPTTPDGGASTDASHTFSGLKQNVSYDIQVKTSDISGNPGTGTIMITTGTVPDAGDGQTGSIVWGNVNWDPSQGTASITVSKGAGVDESLQIQYQVVANGGSISESAYQTISNGGTIQNLTHGSVVYARLWDGTNGGNPASINIQDNVKPSATIQFTENTADVGAQITATVTQTDNESGVASGKYIFNTVSENIEEGEASYTGTISGTTVTVSASAEGTYYLHVLTIDRAGNKKETISGAVTIEVPETSAEDIENNPSQYYGQYVNYTPKNNASVKWRIFYAGTNPNVTSDTTSRIYLIADDYISSQYAPNGKEGSEIIAYTDYRLSMDNVINDYAGSSNVTNSFVKPWLSYLNSSYGRNSYYDNMKAVAYMLDTNVWSTFTDSAGKAEYAIGGPTLDLFCTSYNQKYSTKTIQYQSDTYGYNVRWSTGESYDYYIDGLPTNDGLYVISSSSKAEYMWLASPSALDLSTGQRSSGDCSI